VLRSSFIVGCPGETDKDFADLCRLVKDLQFDRVGVVRYSREENTEAAAMPGHVTESTKAERWHIVMELLRGIARHKNAAWVGRTVPALGCGFDRERRTYGRTAAQAPDIDEVVFLEEGFVPGVLAPVRITDS